MKSEDHHIILTTNYSQNYPSTAIHYDNGELDIAICAVNFHVSLPFLIIETNLIEHQP